MALEDDVDRLPDPPERRRPLTAIDYLRAGCEPGEAGALEQLQVDHDDHQGERLPDKF